MVCPACRAVVGPMPRGTKGLINRVKAVKLVIGEADAR